MATETNTTPAGYAPHLARLFTYAEPRRRMRAWLRAAALTLATALTARP